MTIPMFGDNNVQDSQLRAGSTSCLRHKNEGSGIQPVSLPSPRR